LSVLAGAKNPTGQTAPENRGRLEKNRFQLFSTADKHKTIHHGLISIKNNIIWLISIKSYIVLVFESIPHWLLAVVKGPPADFFVIVFLFARAQPGFVTHTTGRCDA
jgi:hypothetical protein